MIAAARVHPRPENRRAFSIVELLVVIVIILVLAGLVLGVSKYVQDKGARSRAETEIAAMSAALESYKADNGIYPRANVNPAPGDVAPFATDNLDARTDLNSDPKAANSKYAAASLVLYKQLSGDSAGNRQATGRSYFTFPPTMLYPKNASLAVTAIIDRWGNSFGYSTANQYSAAAGYNPTFDLWSTGIPTPTPSATPTPTPQNSWVKNW